MLLIIDGYNFLYALFGLEHRVQEIHKDRDAARQELQSRLVRYQNVTGEQIRIVYDARGGLQVPNEHFAGIDIIYAPPNSDADAHIVRCVRNSGAPAEITVVTTDHDLTLRVEKAGGKTIKSGEFYKKMQERIGERADSEEEDDKAADKPEQPSQDEIERLEKAFEDDPDDAGPDFELPF